MTDLSSSPNFAALQQLCPEAVAHMPPNDWMLHGTQSLVYVIPFFLIDFLVLKRISALNDSKTRWFAIHAIANGIVVVTTVPDLYNIATAPICALISPCSQWTPVYVAIAVHLYHFLAFTNMRFDDIMHHVVFVGSFAFFNYQIPFGRIPNAILFFITGLPGGSTYAMLVLVKLGLMGSLTEKRISAELNTYMRAPGLVMCSVIMMACFMHGAYHAWPIAVIVCAFLSTANGLYYGQMAQDNYAEKRTRSRSASLSCDPDHADIVKAAKTE